MYEDLIRKLRNCSSEAAPCRTCEMMENNHCTDDLMREAADAIELLESFRLVSLRRSDGDT